MENAMSTGTLPHSGDAQVPEVWSESYPPDFDHGGEPLLGDDPTRWRALLRGVAFLGAECALDGRVVVVVASVCEGFVEVVGQFVRQGEALAEPIARSLLECRERVPVDRDASRLLGLEVELDQAPVQLDWRNAARRIEVDLLSTIQSRAETSTD